MSEVAKRCNSRIHDLYVYFGLGIAYYVLTTLIVICAVFIGYDIFRPRITQDQNQSDLTSCFARWDGQWYKRIVADGYSYDPDNQSTVAFFPVYPLLARLLVCITGLRPDLALLAIAHLSLISAFILMIAYVRERYKSTSPGLAEYVLLALGLLPFTFFFRMAYSEAPFLLLTILALYGMERKWSLAIIALIIGLATATRPVGLGLLAPLILHIWHRSSNAISFIGTFLCIVPIACWGMAGYMSYQYGQFGDPLAFAKSHGHWRVRPPAPLLDKLIALETLEPIWSICDSWSPCCWNRTEFANAFLFNPRIADRVYFLGAVVLAAVGKYKRWLSSYELVLVVSLLFIPYVGRGYDMCMASMARFTSVAFPIYLVLGNLLWRIQVPLAAGFLAISSLLLGVNAALFAARYPFF
jgi:hypothetical protein